MIESNMSEKEFDKLIKSHSIPSDDEINRVSGLVIPNMADRISLVADSGLARDSKVRNGGNYMTNYIGQKEKAKMPMWKRMTAAAAACAVAVGGGIGIYLGTRGGNDDTSFNGVRYGLSAEMRQSIYETFDEYEPSQHIVALNARNEIHEMDFAQFMNQMITNYIRQTQNFDDIPWFMEGIEMGMRAHLSQMVGSESPTAESYSYTTVSGLNQHLEAINSSLAWHIERIKADHLFVNTDLNIEFIPFDINTFIDGLEHITTHPFDYDGKVTSTYVVYSAIMPFISFWMGYIEQSMINALDDIPMMERVSEFMDNFYIIVGRNAVRFGWAIFGFNLEVRFNMIGQNMNMNWENLIVGEVNNTGQTQNDLRGTAEWLREVSSFTRGNDGVTFSFLDRIDEYTDAEYWASVLLESQSGQGGSNQDDQGQNNNNQ